MVVYSEEKHHEEICMSESSILGSQWCAKPANPYLASMVDNGQTLLIFTGNPCPVVGHEGLRWTQQPRTYDPLHSIRYLTIEPQITEACRPRPNPSYFYWKVQQWDMRG